MQQDIMDNGRSLMHPAFDALFDLRNPSGAKKYVYNTPHSMERHNHDFPQLWYCQEGEYLHRVRDQVYTCKKGSLIIIPPGVFHRFSIPEGGRAALWRINIRYDSFLDTPPHLYINAISGLFLPAFQEELGWQCPEYTELSAGSADTVEACISQLVALDLAPQSVAWMHSCEIMEALFSIKELQLPQQLRQRAMTLAQNRMRPIIRVLNYLNTNYPQNITAQELQQVSTMCQTQFFRSFRQFTGCTFSVYLQQLRVLRAKDYLSFTNYSLAFISDVCGFANQGHMTNCYKKHLGLTPKEVRAKMLEFKKDHPDYKRNVRAF